MIAQLLSGPPQSAPPDVDIPDLYADLYTSPIHPGASLLPPPDFLKDAPPADPESAQDHEPAARVVGYPGIGSATPAEQPPPQQQQQQQQNHTAPGNETAPIGSGGGGGSEPRIQAFAKLEFDDGHFYVNTYSFVLGRDVRAARAAYQREMRSKHSRALSSSGGPAPHPPTTPNRRPDSSAYVGSVVSDKGGIMGYDPDVPQQVPLVSWKSSNSSAHEQSAAPLLHVADQQQQQQQPESLQLESWNPPPAPEPEPKDYNALAMQSLAPNDARPVDTLSLLPSPDACPTIPIHPPATASGSVASHRGISRKHVRISYNFDTGIFEMEVMGRNGAFLNLDWLAPHQLRPLHSGDYIQIGGVRVRFVLPDVPVTDNDAAELDDEEDVELAALEQSGALPDDLPAAADPDAPSSDDDIAVDSEHEDEPPKKKLKIKLTAHPDQAKRKLSLDEPSSSAAGAASAAAGGVPPKRRGPGRPPKDGIMSKRERAEIAREQKLAARRQANGGITPPPSGRKPSASKGLPREKEGSAGAGATAGVEEQAIRPEKRKYTKRKSKVDGVTSGTPMPADIAMQSIEGADYGPDAGEDGRTVPSTSGGAGSGMFGGPSAPGAASSGASAAAANAAAATAAARRQRKPSKSPSPDYPPESAYSPEELAKPPYNYAVLIFDCLSDSTAPMTLKQIYRALKLKYPYFRFRCETEGWTSSVRHNLNGNSHLFTHAERDGKGWSWKLVPGASVDKEKKRRPSPPPPGQGAGQLSHQSPPVASQNGAYGQPSAPAHPPPPHHHSHPHASTAPHALPHPPPPHPPSASERPAFQFPAALTNGSYAAAAAARGPAGQTHGPGPARSRSSLPPLPPPPQQSQKGPAPLSKHVQDQSQISRPPSAAPDSVPPAPASAAAVTQSQPQQPQQATASTPTPAPASTPTAIQAPVPLSQTRAHAQAPPQPQTQPLGPAPPPQPPRGQQQPPPSPSQQQQKQKQQKQQQPSQSQHPPPFPIPAALRNPFPTSFAARGGGSTYRSPYASAPPPPPVVASSAASAGGHRVTGSAVGTGAAKGPSAAAPAQQQPQPQPQPQPPSSAAVPPQPQSPQPQPQPPPPLSSTPTSNSTFLARANHAIDDFEAAMLEDSDDKAYMRRVLRSARNRVLHGATGVSTGGGSGDGMDEGEPRAEEVGVIVDTLKAIIGQLN